MFLNIYRLLPLRHYPVKNAVVNEANLFDKFVVDEIPGPSGSLYFDIRLHVVSGSFVFVGLTSDADFFFLQITHETRSLQNATISQIAE